MTPYYQDRYVTLYNSDCREVMSELNTAQYFCFTDPPYNVGKDYGVWNDALLDEEYLAFCDRWIAQITKLCQEVCIYTPRKYLLDYWNLLGSSYKQIVLTWNPEGAIRGGFVNQHA